MGYWVHCHGSINVLIEPMVLGPVDKSDIIAALGNILNVDSEEDWSEYAADPDSFTPSSADGVVEYTIVRKRAQGIWRIKFSGALGDAYDLKPVLDWWYKACGQLPIVGAEIWVSDDFKSLKASIDGSIYQ